VGLVTYTAWGKGYVWTGDIKTGGRDDGDNLPTEATWTHYKLFY
jgi:hypothetical protein